jgi:hypothetical protein
MRTRQTGTMYLPCPGCGQIRTLRVNLDAYAIGKALDTNCPPCSIKARYGDSTHSARSNAAALADELALIGGPPEEAARRLGTTPTALARRFYRAGLPELARPFQRASQARRRRRAA